MVDFDDFISNWSSDDTDWSSYDSTPDIILEFDEPDEESEAAFEAIFNPPQYTPPTVNPVNQINNAVKQSIVELSSISTPSSAISQLSSDMAAKIEALSNSNISNLVSSASDAISRIEFPTIFPEDMQFDISDIVQLSKQEILSNPIDIEDTILSGWNAIDDKFGSHLDVVDGFLTRAITAGNYSTEQLDVLRDSFEQSITESNNSFQSQLNYFINDLDDQLSISVDRSLGDMSSAIDRVSSVVSGYKDMVSSLASDGINVVHQAMIDTIRSADSPYSVALSIQTAQSAFADIISASQSAQDIIDSNASKWIDAALAGSEYITDSAILAANEIKSRANFAESTVFDATELARSIVSAALSSAQDVISESESDIVKSSTGIDLGAILREYNAQVGSTVVDQVPSLPGDTINVMRESLVFKNVLTDALGTGKPDDVIHDVLTSFGHEIVTLDEATQLQKSGDLEGKYVYDPSIGFSLAVSNDSFIPLNDDVSNFILDFTGVTSPSLSDMVSLSNDIRIASLYPMESLVLPSAYFLDEGKLVPVTDKIVSEVSPDVIKEMHDRLSSFGEKINIDAIPYDKDEHNCLDYAKSFAGLLRNAIDSSSYDRGTIEKQFKEDISLGYVRLQDGIGHAVVLVNVGNTVYEKDDGTQYEQPAYIVYDPQALDYTGGWFDPSYAYSIGATEIVAADNITWSDDIGLILTDPSYVYVYPGEELSEYTLSSLSDPARVILSSPSNVAKTLSTTLGKDVNIADVINRSDLYSVSSPLSIQLLDLAGIPDSIKLSELTLPELVVLNEVLKGTELDYSTFYSPETTRAGWLTEVSHELSPNDIENIIAIGSVIQQPTVSAQGIIDGIKSKLGFGDKDESSAPSASESKDATTSGAGAAPSLTVSDVKKIQESQSDATKYTSFTPSSGGGGSKTATPSTPAGEVVDISASRGYKTMTDLSVLDPSHPEHDVYMEAYSRKSSPTQRDKDTLSYYGVPDGGLQAGLAAYEAQKSLETADLSTTSKYVQSINDLVQQQAKVGQPVDTKVLDFKQLAQQTTDSDRGITETVSVLDTIRTAISADPSMYSVVETISKIIPEELVTTTTSNRYTNAGLIDGGRATEEGRQLANDLITTMLVTGGPIVEESSLKTFAQLASPAFPVTAVLKEGGIIDGIDVNGTKFSESEMVDFVLKYGSDDQIAALRSSGTVSKYLSTESPDEWSTAKIRTSSNEQISEIVKNTKDLNTETYVILTDRAFESEDGNLRWSAVSDDNRILTLADGTKVITKSDYDDLSLETGYNASNAGIRTFPKGMDVEVGLSLRADDIIKSTTWKGDLNLTDIGENIVLSGYNKLIVDPNSSIPDENKELVSYGLDDYQIEMLAKPGVDTVVNDVEIQLPSLLDNITDNKLYENISNRAEIASIASNPGAALAITYKNDWLDRGWIDIDGSVTPSGVAARDAIVSSAILDNKGAADIDGTTVYLSPSIKAFALSTINNQQQDAIKSNAGAYERLTSSEQLTIGERDKSIGERLTSLTNSAAEIGWEYIFAPGFEDEGLNAALFLSGILPIGKIGSIGSKGIRALLKSDDGVKILTNAFKKSDDISASAKSLLDAETKLGKNSDEFAKLVSSLKKELGEDNYAKLADRVMEIRGAASVLDPEWVTSSSLAKVLSTARTADGQAALAKISDRDFALLKTYIGDADKLAAITKERDSAIRAAKQFTREPEFQTAEEAKSFLDWGAYQEKLAGKSPEIIEQVKKNTGLGANIDSAVEVGKNRLAYKSSTGKSVFESVSSKPLSHITKEEAALLSSNEILNLQSKATTTAEIGKLMDLRSEGLADLIRSSPNAGRLTEYQNQIIQKMSRGGQLTTSELTELEKMSKIVGESSLKNLFNTYVTGRNALAAVGGAVGGTMLLRGIVGNFVFGQFIVEEQDQVTGPFLLMGASSDPIKFSDALTKSCASWSLASKYMDSDLVRMISENEFLTAWLYPNAGTLAEYHNVGAVAYLETQRDKAIEQGAWIMTEKDGSPASYTTTIGFGDNVETITVTGWGRPATLDELLDALDQDPAKLDKLERSDFDSYVDLLYSERGWDNERLAQEVIDGNILEHKYFVPAEVQALVDAAFESQLPLQVRSGEFTLPEYIQQGLTLKDSWRVPEVQAQFLKSDGSWDAQKIAFAIDRGQLGLYELGTYTPDATRALLEEAARNIDLTDTLYNALKDEDTFKTAMETLDPETWGILAQTVGIPAENLYMLEDDPKLGKVFQFAGLPDSIPIFSIGVSSDEMANRVLYDEGISQSDRRVWLDTFDDVSLTNDEVGYLYASGVISDLYKYNLPSDIEKQIINTVSTLGKDAAADRYLELSGHQFIALDSPIGPKTVSVTTEVTTSLSVGTDRFKTISMLIDNPSLLSSYYNDPTFKAEFNLLYSEDPSLALNIYNAVLGMSDSAFRDDYINSLTPEQRGRLIEGFANSSNYTTNGKVDSEKGSYISDRRLYWTDSAGDSHYAELTNSKVKDLCSFIYDPATGTTYTKSDLAKQFGIPEDKFTIDGAKWVDYVAGKYNLTSIKDILIYDSQESAKKYSSGGGGGGGGGGGTSTRKSTTTSYYASGTIGLFVDCNVEADVATNGETIGVTGKLIPLAPGEYTITVSKTGYAPKTMVVMILSTKATNLSVTLYPGDYTVCDFVESLGGTTSVQKIHFVYAYCKYRNWDQAATAALALFTAPDMMPDDFSRDDAQYLYYLADGYYSDAQAMIDAGTICGVE